jgi:hypothetical protein
MRNALTGHDTDEDAFILCEENYEYYSEYLNDDDYTADDFFKNIFNYEIDGDNLKYNPLTDFGKNDMNKNDHLKVGVKLIKGRSVLDA